MILLKFFSAFCLMLLMADGGIRLKKVILLIILIVIDFIYYWCFQRIFADNFLLCIVIFIGLLVGWGVNLVYILRSNGIFQKIILFVFVGSYIIFKFSGCIDIIKFNMYQEKREEIVKMIVTGKLKKDDKKDTVNLPVSYEKFSDGGEVVMLDSDEKIMVGFWENRGFLNSGMDLYVYSENNSEDELIYRLKKCWWYLEQIKIKEI